MANPISNVVEGLAQRLFFQEMYVKLTDKTLSIFCMTRRYNENREIFNGGKPPNIYHVSCMWIYMLFVCVIEIEN